MKLTPLENQLIQKHLHGLADTPEAARMKQYIQHGRVSTYDHVISVARLSLLINHRLHLGACDRELVRGAFLHDFYLYDWHKNGYAGRLAASSGCRSKKCFHALFPHTMRKQHY